MKKIIILFFLLLNLVVNAQEEKTVTLNVSGTGKTLEEARLNALRSAIEQAFGAFISSKTEILNDNLVKDEIVSVANGNIQKYEVVSQVEMPNVGYAITLNATVSISKLTSFAESKGVVVEFKGGMFAANMKLQKINEDAELIAIKNLITVCFELLKKSLDYELVVSEPKAVNSSNENYEITFDIGTKENLNYNNFINYFISTIKNIALSNEEYENLNKIGKKVRYLYMDGKLYKFRNENTSYILTSFFATAQLLCMNINITSNLGELKFDKMRISGSVPILLNARILKPAEFRGNDEIFNLLNSQNLPDDYDFRILNNENLSAKFISEYSFFKYNDETFNFENCISYYSNRDNIKELAYKLSTSFFNRIIIFDTRFNSPKFKIKKIISLNELQKIDAFKIEKKEFN